MLNFITEALLLGISTGVYCFSQCGIVVVPYVLTENANGFKSHYPIVFQFLLGRFIAYTLIGLLVGYLGQSMFGLSFFNSNSGVDGLIGISYIVLSVLLVLNAVFHNTKNEPCRFDRFKKYSRLPMLLGIITGINICPPFILAITKAFNARDMVLGAIFFIMFFLATSVFILPLLFSGLLKRIEEIKKIARITSVLAGGYLAVNGIIYLFF